MAVLAVISTPNTDGAPDSAPRRIVSDLPSIEIEVVQFERDGTVAVPYLWMQGVSVAAFERAVADDPHLSTAEQLEQTDDGTLYKVRWEVDSPSIHCMIRSNGMVMQARGTVDEWRLKIWFETRADAAAFQQCCNSRDVPLDVNQLGSFADVVSDGGGNLSASQRETILLAYREGYFEVPREVSQRELADELGVSSSAVGARLRRGLANLIEEGMID